MKKNSSIEFQSINSENQLFDLPEALFLKHESYDLLFSQINNKEENKRHSVEEIQNALLKCKKRDLDKRRSLEFSSPQPSKKQKNMMEFWEQKGRDIVLTVQQQTKEFKSFA